jgi:bifunctional non-homologous end joining protein LigD
VSVDLRDYTTKRDFSKTSEPRGARSKTTGDNKLTFVVQKHAARRLHYDLRLELDGTLKSWAVAKGPSLVPGEKRLAIHVEDHPLEYGSFEGNIPAGQYGAGSVIVWDRGTWLPDGDPHKGLAKGHLAFDLDGSKLKGHWHLVRMKRRPKEKQESWLLIKSDDAAARDQKAPDILDEKPNSIVTRKSVEAVAKSGAGAAVPSFIEPCLAKLSDKPPTGKSWIHEIKFDGYRIQACKGGDKVALFTRSGLNWTGKFGALSEAFKAISASSAVIDGELVVEKHNGIPSFSALQVTLKDGRDEELRYYAFDLLSRDGKDLRQLPLSKRNKQLHEVLSGLPEDSPIRISEHLSFDGKAVLDQACRMGLEGIVSKRIDRPYRSGRGGDWIKSKCTHSDEFVVIGYSASTTTRRAIGSLALAQYDKGRLVYRGRVGTGFSEEQTAALFKKLEPLKRSTPPLDYLPPEEKGRGLRWTEPHIVADIEFRNWTNGGLISHSVFRGLRDDKAASEATSEERMPATAHAPRLPEFDDSKLTHPERLLWPDAGVTKLGLAQFYAEIWSWIAPHIVRRPLSLLRCPEGISETCFFQKHAWAGLDSSIKKIRPPGDDQDILYIEDFDGLLGLVQASVLELHPWGSLIDDIERPDRITFDLDPGPGLQWTDVIEAAHEVRSALSKDGLESFVKTTGGKGLHVVVPLHPGADWLAAKEYARTIAEHMAALKPGRYTASMAKRSRNRRIFIDYLRNARGATAVAAYSTRARDGAPVSTPIGWEELNSGVGPAHYSVSNLTTRLHHLSDDPWAAFSELRQTLPAPTKKGGARPSKGRTKKNSAHKPSKQGT